jgi:hypothetical protein
MAGVLPYQAAQQNTAYNHSWSYIDNQQQQQEPKSLQWDEQEIPDLPGIIMKNDYPGANSGAHQVPVFISQGNGSQPGRGGPSGPGQLLRNGQPINTALQPSQGSNALPQFPTYPTNQGYPGQATNSVVNGSQVFQPLSKKQRLLGPSGQGGSHGAGAQGMPGFPGEFRQQMEGMPTMPGHMERGAGGRPSGVPRDSLGSPSRPGWQPVLEHSTGRQQPYNMFNNSQPSEQGAGPMGSRER